jgi:hypothetical protein
MWYKVSATFYEFEACKSECRDSSPSVKPYPLARGTFSRLSMRADMEVAYRPFVAVIGGLRQIDPDQLAAAKGVGEQLARNWPFRLVLGMDIPHPYSV